MKNIKQSKTTKSAKRGRKLWHPAFVEAFKMELFLWKDLLDFEAEHQLNAAPFIVDILIRKKRKDAVIENNIAAIFRGYNIVEYKSPKSHISIGDYHKVGGYARHYSFLNKVDITDITITFVEDRYPRKLFAFLRDVLGFRVTEKWAGIYHVKGDMMPVQVINRKRLDAESNLWIKSLGDDLSISGLSRIVKERQKSRMDDSLSAYMHVLLESNTKTVEEFYRMKNKNRETLEDVLERLGLTKQWEARGKSEGIAIGEARAKAEVAAERERMRRENERLRRENERLKALV
jgi:hypothetical protein